MGKVKGEEEEVREAAGRWSESGSLIKMGRQQRQSVTWLIKLDITGVM